MEMNQKYLTNDFLKQLYKSVQPKRDLLNCREEEFEQVRSEGQKNLHSILKLEELEKTFGRDLEYELDDKMTSMNIEIDKYCLRAVEGLEYPVFHIKPNKPNGKVILYLHGHDDLGVLGALLDRTDKIRYHKIIPVKLAKEGYEIIAPELMGYGDSRYYGFPKGEDNLAGCFIHDRYLTLAGFSMAGFRVYQTIKTLDFMECLGIKGDITAFGISGGGLICQHVSVLEDRIKNVIVACYSNTYMDSILWKEHCTDNYVPGLLRAGDSYQLLSYVAPKPLLTVNGIWDRAFPLVGSEKAFDYLRKVYERLGISDKYDGILFEGKHEIDENIIMDWLNKNA